MKQAKAGTRQHEHAVSDPSMPWTHDTLGSPFEQRTIHLGLDPDGEGEVVATLIRRRCCTTPRRAAVIHVHGWSDYFFQTAMADHFDAMGIAFYALDLRKCGRSHRPGQTRHYASDLSLYDAELQAALDIVRDEQPDTPILMLGHSTGALIQALWLDRLNRRPGGTEAAGITGFIANGPWLDLQGGPWMRTVATWLFAQLARFRPLARVPFPTADGYGVSLHSSAKGQWDFDVRHKPIGAFPITFGWITAIRRGHARVHRGLDIGVPALVLRSDRSVFSRRYRSELDRADAVVDVGHISRWTGSLGAPVTSLVTIEGARHDAFLSEAEPRRATYAALDTWIDAQLGSAPDAGRRSHNRQPAANRPVDSPTARVRA